MRFSVNFLERREGDSPSIERVFRSVAAHLQNAGIGVRFSKATYGNSFFSTLRNLAFFRPDAADIYHITGHISFMALVLPRARTVLTIHDLTILDHRTGIRRWLIKWLYFVLPARRARFVTAISSATRRKLAAIATIPADRITVIENPLLVSEATEHNFNLDKPTVLQIGTAPNKNVDKLIEALAGVRCRLRIVGPLNTAQESRLDQGKFDWSNDTYLDDEAMEAAYEDADVVTLCSTDEGFGLPIIEAQAKGAIVVTSDRPPMSDVAGRGAKLVDPDSVDSIRAGILEVIENADLRNRLVATGRENIRRFDSERIAAQYVALYERMLMEL